MTKPLKKRVTRFRAPGLLLLYGLANQMVYYPFLAPEKYEKDPIKKALLEISSLKVFSVYRQKYDQKESTSK